MSTRTLAGTGEAALAGETDIVCPLIVPVTVYLPIIGDGTGGTVSPGYLVSVTTQAIGMVETLDHTGRCITTVRPRHSKLFCAVEAPGGFGWSYTDYPLAYPSARVTGSSGGETPDTIADVLNLQSTLDGKAPLVHTHIIANVTGLQATLDGKAALAHTHDAGDVISGTLAVSRLATGVPDATKFARGDGTWAVPPTGGGAATTIALGTVEVDNNSGGTPVALTSAGHGAAADPHTQYELRTDKNIASGYAGLDASSKLNGSQQSYGATATTAAAGNDARLSDSRTPLAHKASHQTGGGDEINVGGLVGVLANPQPPIIGATGTTAVAGNDVRLADSRTPLAHHTTHETAGADRIILAAADIPALDAAKVTTGVLAVARLATGTADGRKWVRDDGTLQYVDNPGPASSADQTIVAATTAYLVGSAIPVPTGKLRIGTVLSWRISLSKSAAGLTTSSIFLLKIGTLGTTADATVLTFTLPATQTAVADDAHIDITVTVRGPLSASGLLQGQLVMEHNLASTGFAGVPCVVLKALSAAFNVTTASLIAGIACTTAAATVLTFQQVISDTKNL